MGPDVDVNDWAEGSAPLGYGEGFIATELSFGPDSKQKWASAFFRAEFSRSSKRSLAKLRVKVRRDDGILLYLNGKEILRQHLPDTSTVAWTAYATQEVGGIEEALYYVTEIDPKLLKEQNVLAAQVHQCNGNSSDLSFDLSMEGLLGPDDVE